MKIAIVCDDLVQFGGAEKVVMTILEIWKDAPLYTSVASDEWVDLCSKKGINLHTSFMQKIPFAAKMNRYLAPFFLYIIAFQSFDFSEFDIVLSLSSRFSHHIITKPQTKNICYMHSPGRMFWEPFEYFQNEAYGFLKPLKKLAPYFLILPLSVIRVMDYFSSKRIDHVISNSITAKTRVKKYYGIDSKVINPPVNLEEFQEKNCSLGDYFLIITRLISWKRVDIAIEACEDKGVPLKIAGDGPDKKRLRGMSCNNTEFLGYVDGEKKTKLLNGCRAVINTQLEDFGIVPLEALACGKPVIAFGKGGVLEIIEPGITGEFFYEQTPESLKKILDKFDESKYNPENCIQRAREFSREKFKQKMIEYVNNVYL
jgi:glycosyltransferase involved in cell wall biosynthesis